MTTREEIRDRLWNILPCPDNSVDCELKDCESCESRERQLDKILENLHSVGCVLKVDREFAKPRNYHSPCLPYAQGYHHATIDHKEAGYVAVEPLIKEG